MAFLPRGVRLLLLSAGLLIASCGDNGGSVPDKGPGRGDARILAEDTAALCSDGQDNDADGFPDCADQDCWPLSACAPDSGSPDAAPPDNRRSDGPAPPTPDGPAPPLPDGPVAPPPDGPAPPVPDALPADTLSPDSGVLPGCGGALCPSGSVCHNATCTVPGPTKTCGTATYPAIPSSGTGGVSYQGVLHVNAAHSGVSDGSATQPFKTISAALATIPANQTYAIAVAAGSYDEVVEIGQRLGGTVGFGAHLFCRCPQQVQINQPIRVRPLASGIVRAVIDGCSVVPKGVDPDTSCQWPSATCSAPYGLEAVGGNAELHLLVRESVIAGWCTGLYYSGSPQIGLDASLCVTRSRLTKNRIGVEVLRAPTNKLVAAPFAECQNLAENLALVLDRLDHNRDYAVNTHMEAQGIAMQANLVEGGGTLCGKQDGEGYGVYLGDAFSAVLAANVVRDNLNRGIGLRNDAEQAYSIKVQDNLVAGNRGAGIAMQKMQAQLNIYVTGNVVTNTAARAASEPGGDGLLFSVFSGVGYNVDVSGNTIDASSRIGAFFDGVGGALQNNTVSNSGTYGCVLQQSAASVGSNTWVNNALGNVQTYSSPVEKYGSLPVPLP
jgi:hypothetical protein